jgi:hypothetical protein
MDSSALPGLRNLPALATRPMPDGPVVLWIAVFTAAGELMGAAPAELRPAWLWRDGRLCVAYGPVTVTVFSPGWYAFGVICAVPLSELGASHSRVSRMPFVPLWRISLGEPQELRAGDNIHVLDGVVAIIPEYGDRPGPEPAPPPG